MENFLSANPTKAALKMRQELAKTIKKIRSSNDLRTSGYDEVSTSKGTINGWI